MNTHTNKLLLSFFLLNAYGTHTLYSCFQPTDFKFAFPPLVEPKDQQLITQRKRCFNTPSKEVLKEIFPQSKLIFTFDEYSRPGTCHDWSISKTLGLSHEQLKTIHTYQISCQHWIEILEIPYCFFEQIKEPEADCLITYTKNTNPFHILHTAIAIKNNLFESKRGIYPEIIQHVPWDIDDIYGNEIRAWKLKQQYKNDKNLLLCDIINKIKQSLPQLIHFYYDLKNNFFSLSHLNDIREKLIRNPGLDINARDEKGKTLLLYAKEQKNKLLEKLLLLYGADQIDINLKYYDTFLNTIKEYGFSITYTTSPPNSNHYHISKLSLSICILSLFLCVAIFMAKPENVPSIFFQGS